MKSIIQSKCRHTTKKLFESLDRVEQVAQAIRWQISNLQDDLSNSNVEVGRLTGESWEIAKLLGELIALRDMEGHVDDVCVCDSCGTYVLTPCEECSCYCCDDCLKEHADRLLCDECHAILTEEGEDTDAHASPDNNQSAMQAA